MGRDPQTASRFVVMPDIHLAGQDHRQAMALVADLDECVAGYHSERAVPNRCSRSISTGPRIGNIWSWRVSETDGAGMDLILLTGAREHRTVARAIRPRSAPVGGRRQSGDHMRRPGLLRYFAFMASSER